MASIPHIHYPKGHPVSALVNVWRKLPATIRHGLGEAAALWVVAFGTALGALGASRITVAAIVACAVAAAKVVIAHFFPQVQIITLPPAPPAPPAP